MNPCFEKFVDHKKIMLDGLDKIVAYKIVFLFSNSMKITQKDAVFSDFIKLYEYWGNFKSFFMRQKIFCENDNETNP